ncbi:hypothetical protein LTR37_007986 [Vermiconidia calcicola]|uniref:Uncharacterized protein n=1 Tax=Vermiconidia calcicola TaxID=1690605 RepID=A0ACC3ND64_9PEZI|nr:hypothetical protein LTR37_007986 [Vermiconidia calcicola]
MHISAAVVLAVAGFATAQSSSSAVAASSSSAPAASSSGSPSGCGDAFDVIIQDCLANYNKQIGDCSDNDWSCLCFQSKNILTCYNNCPDDPNAFGAQQESQQYCQAAQQYGSTTTKAPKGAATAGTAASLATAATTTSSDSNAVHSGFAEASGSAVPAEGAAYALTPAGGILAAIFGLAML